MSKIMLKKSQITLFMIIGIVLAVSFMVVYTNLNTLARPEVTKKDLSVPAQFEPIKMYIDSCVKKNTREAIMLSGFQGGLINPIDGKSYLLYTKYFQMAFWFFNGNDISLTNDEIASGISDYVDMNLISCLKNFTGLGYDVRVFEPDSLVKITSNAILVDLSMKVKANIAGVEYEHDRFLISVDTEFGNLIDVAHKIVEDEVLHPGEITVPDTKYDIVLNKYSDETYIITLTDKDELISGSPLMFNFASYYDFSLNNNDPELYTISDFDVQVGDTVDFEVLAYDKDEDNLTFKVLSPMVDITGDTIHFTADSTMVGNNTVTVVVEDGRGGIDSETFTINVYRGDWKETEHAPVLNIPDELNITGGETFSYKVLAYDEDGDYLRFSDDFSIFDITIDGNINYIPLLLGSFRGNITVSDGTYSDTKEVVFNVQ